MEVPNDNGKLSSAKDFERSLQSEDGISSWSCPSSDLVTTTKLLTREEECTLKTALAFVVIKARAGAKSKAALEDSPAIDNRTKKQKTMESSSRNAVECDSSVLDHLFCHRRSQRFPNPSLECKGDQHHIDYMFRAAKTLAETWLVARRTQNAEETRASKALEGATGHLARQLQVLLVANANCHVSNPSTKQSTARSNHEEEKQTPPKTRYRRTSLSSKSTVDSTSTPSASSRMGSSAMVVTPATHNSKSHSNSQSQSQNSNSFNTEEDRIGEDNLQNNGRVVSLFLVQEWIRSTLLDDGDYRQHAATNDTVDRVSRTILSRQNTTILDALSSFHVYAVMVPQLARISPPLIGHIFQVVAKVVRDLYNDKIAVAGEDCSVMRGGQNRSISGDKLLDHLATSALGLLELCWTTKITGGRESHRSFLLLSLQQILGDLLVPLSRQKLAGEHYQLTISEARRHSALRQEPLVLQPNGFSRFSEAAHHQTLRQVAAFTRAKNLASRDESGEVRKFHAPRTLDPESKLLLRMAVYRLLLMGKRG